MSTTARIALAMGLWLVAAPAWALPRGGDAAGYGPASGEGELVVLVHGMGRTRLSMRPMERALEAAGYEVLNYGYPSRRRTVAESGQALAEAVARAERPAGVVRIHFVGHSLGNIVIRWVLSHRPPAKLGRIVMLAPPNQGARRADLASPWLSWLSEPLPDLTTDPNSAARALPTPAGLEIGVIAGARDHTVRLPETYLAGQTDHAVVGSGHTFIMRRPVVHQLAVQFLRTGRFFGAWPGADETASRP